MKRASTAAIVLAGAFWPPGAQAESVQVTATSDNTLYENATGSLSNGAGEFLFAGRTGQTSNFRRRALLRFELPGHIPPKATITSVALTMNCSGTNAASTTLSLHLALAAWGEGTSDPGTPGGSGAPSTPDDATWLHRFYDSTFWTNPGGDFDGPVLSTATVTSVGPVSWNGTPELLAAVQSWLDDPDSNFGLVIVGDETTPQSSCSLVSRENSVAEDRPILSITFEEPVDVPAASTWGLISLALLMVTFGSRYVMR